MGKGRHLGRTFLEEPDPTGEIRLFAAVHPGSKAWASGRFSEARLRAENLSHQISTVRGNLTRRMDDGEGFEIVEFKLVEVARHPRRKETP